MADSTDHKGVAEGVSDGYWQAGLAFDETDEQPLTLLYTEQDEPASSPQVNPVVQYLGVPESITWGKLFLDLMTNWYEIIRMRAEGVPDIEIVAEPMAVDSSREELNPMPVQRFFDVGEPEQSGQTHPRSETPREEQRQLLSGGASHYELLMSLTKDRLRSIRQAWGFDGMSQLTKAELAKALADRIPHRLTWLFVALGKNVYQLSERLLSGPTRLQDLSPEEGSCFRFLIEFGIVFPYAFDDDAWMLPSDLMPAIEKTIESPEVRSLIEVLDEFLTVGKGLLLYYGIMPIWSFLDKLLQLVPAEFEMYELFALIWHRLQEHPDIVYSDSYVYLKSVIEPQTLLAEQERRAELEFYPVTQTMAKKAAQLGCVEMNAKQRKMYRHLQADFGLPAKEAMELIRGCFLLVNNGYPLEALMDFVLEHVGLSDQNEIEALAELLVQFHNHTRQWMLKGHTPAEVHAQTKSPAALHSHRHSRPTLPTKAPKGAAVKVGRNDPCPCGSGKKYKKCCGR